MYEPGATMRVSPPCSKGEPPGGRA
jgi:hypothetical protein